MKKQALKLMYRLHKDETGQMPVADILMFAAISVPMILGLVTFTNELLEWFSQRFSELTR